MFTPVTPTLGFAGVYLFFLFLLQNIDCGYSLEPPRRGRFLSKNKKNIKNFLMKFSIFKADKNHCILHGHVFVMLGSQGMFIIQASSGVCHPLTIVKNLLRNCAVNCHVAPPWEGLKVVNGACYMANISTTLIHPFFQNLLLWNQVYDNKT